MIIVADIYIYDAQYKAHVVFREVDSEIFFESVTIRENGHVADVSFLLHNHSFLEEIMFQIDSEVWF